MESENSYADFDMMMDDAMSRLNIIVDSTSTLSGKKTSSVGELIYQKPQIDYTDHDTLMDYLDEQEDNSDCDCDYDCDRECNNIHKSRKCVKLTQIYDSSAEIDTIETIKTNDNPTFSSLGENNVYKINYDDRYDERYEFYGDDNCDDSDEVYENIEHSYHAEKMDKQLGNFGRI